MGGMENPLFELISGTSNLNVVHGEFIFWKIFISLIGIILMITGILIGYKKFKNKQLTASQQVVVQPFIRNQECLPLSDSGLQVPFPAWPQNYNTSAQNNPLLNHLQIVVVFGIWVAITAIVILFYGIDKTSDVSLQRQIIFEMTLEYSLFLIFPLLSLTKKTQFRSYLFRELKSIFSFH